ncbi:MAG: hypothetical protein EHM80_11600, partial [Nitrospiraceae bacterium]
MRTDKKPSQKADKKAPSRAHSRGVVGYGKKSVLLEEAITQMNAGKYGRSSAALKELLALDPQNTEARRLFATLHLRLGSLVTARQAFEALANEAIERQDLWLAESLLREYLAAGPRCVPFLERLAYVYDEKGDAMAAVAELGKAIDILLEDPDSDNPKKPAQLYAKVRELAPASPVALQFASLFDIQTGELLGYPPQVSAEAVTLEVDASSPSRGEILVYAEEPRVSSDKMPWEQLDGVSQNQKDPSPTLSNPVIESFDVPETLIDPASVDFTQKELKVSLSESTEAIQETNRLDQEVALSKSAAPSISSNGYRADDTEDPIVGSPPFIGEGLPPTAEEERTGDVGRVITSSVGSSELSSPMPWEQIENATIRIEETAPSTSPLAQSEEVPLLGGETVFASPAITQPKVESDRLSSPTPVPDLTEVRESIFTAEPSTIPDIPQEPEVSTPPAADPSPTVPFSWNTVFDGAWKFAGGTSSSSPAALSQSDAISQEAKDVETVRRDPVPDPVLSVPSITPTPEPLASFNDPEPLKETHPSVLSEGRGPIVETTVIRESDLPQPTEALLS